eukprot:PITA_16222
MILLSWNCRGLASKPKKLALKELVSRYNLDILFLQETLGRSLEVESVLRISFPGWVFHAIDAEGHLGGLAIGVREGRLQINSLWGMAHVLGMEVFSLEMGFPFLVLNIDGPCQGRESFWKNLLSISLLKDRSLILGGDLNFSIGNAEAWGPSAREDPLSDFFANTLLSHKLIDVNLIKVKPTWRNRRAGEGRVANRLDRFLISEDMTVSIPMFRQWVGEGGNSDHFPIIMEFQKPPLKPTAPFKFNASWLQEESYNILFRDTWRHPDSSSSENKGVLFLENLKRPKKATIDWAKARKVSQNEALSKIDAELRALEEPEADGYVNQESKDKVLMLEKQRSKILLDREEEWRLKSRAIWLKAEYENTKFFHNYAKGRKNANTIWKLKDQDGREATSFEDLSRMGKAHFQNLFTEQEGITLAEIIRTAQCFPRFVEEEEAEGLVEVVIKEEVENIIKSMEKDKSPGPNGWTIELFSHFFDSIGDELTEDVEESRRKGEIFPPFNATFIALIPKKEDPDSFEDFRPISLCNCVYKIIAKIIVVRLKPVLSRSISSEQFGFLDGRQIHETKGVAQETIHSIRQSIKKGAVIKIDLSKAYDRISWTYLRMLLTHLGFKLDFINWIMGCVTSVRFAVLINGASSHFFKGQRGLRQGFPLSPLLFLLVAEGLSRLILEARRIGLIKGLEVAVNLFISHLLFVDDILLFTNGSLNELKELKNILDLFMKATGMQINLRKSQLLMEGFSRNECTQITAILPFEVYNMETSFKYLGFWLKPNSYKKQDWNWLVAKIEAKITHWSFKWLSRAGRLTLIKKIYSRFLWSGSKEESVLPWVAWDKIARPKDWGGWGIKNLYDFSISLAAKSGWRLINYENLWTRLVKRKYIDPVPLEEWIRNQNKKGRNVSVIWKATTEAFKVIEQGLAWQVGNGENVRIGKDPWVGCNDLFALSPGLIRHLDSKGSYSPKVGYSFLMSKKGWEYLGWWAKPLWKLKCPKKARMFFWCVLKKKIPTWDVLQARFKQGPGRCPLCKKYSETIFHLFLGFPFTKKVWEEVQKLLKKQLSWEGGTILAAWEQWWSHRLEGNMRNLPPIICWGVWIARNRSIFNDKTLPVEAIAIQRSAILSSIPDPEDTRKKSQSREEQIRSGLSWAYFDGASQNNSAGAGIIIHLNESHSLMASVGIGSESNHFVELSALKLLLCWLIHRHIFAIQIFGDSLNVVKWVNGNSRCLNYILRPLLEEIMILKQSFNVFSIEHIYRDQNEAADNLSKGGLQQAVGIWKLTEKIHEQIRVSDLPPYA